MHAKTTSWSDDDFTRHYVRPVELTDETSVQSILSNPLFDKLGLSRVPVMESDAMVSYYTVENQRQRLLLSGYVCGTNSFQSLLDTVRLLNPYVKCHLVCAPLDMEGLMCDNPGYSDDIEVVIEPIGVGAGRRTSGDGQRRKLVPMPEPPPRKGGGRKGKPGAGVSFGKGTGRSSRQSVFEIPDAAIAGLYRERSGKKKGGTVASIRLPKCTLKYAAAVSVPFEIAARGACVPSTPAVPSQKVHSVIRGDAVIGTTGMGFIAISPCLGNDGIAAYYTNVSFAGTFFQILTANNITGVGISVVSPTNLPFTSAQLASTVDPVVQGRMVAVGVRIQFTGTELNMSGLTYCMEHPLHQNPCLNPGTTIGATNATLGTYEDCEIAALTRSPCHLTLSAKSIGETEYIPIETLYVNAASTTTGLVYPFSNGNAVQNGGFTYSSAGVNAGAPCGVIGFTGVAGQTVHFEIISHVEYVGLATAGRTTENPADSEGVARVLAASARMQVLKTESTGNTSFTGAGMWTLMYRALREVGKEVVKVGVPAAVTALGALLA